MFHFISLLEVQLARLASEGERADNCWSKIEDELSDKMNKMDVALSGIDAEKAETSSMVLSHFRSIRDIPKNFVSEFLSSCWSSVVVQLTKFEI